MKSTKLFLGFAACLMSLTGCSRGIEKEYTMEIKSEPIVARLKADESKTTTVIHCKRRMSLYNYYIELPELAEDFVIPTTLIAKATDTKTKYIIVNEKNKSETVTDHGYVFVEWGKN